MGNPLVGIPRSRELPEMVGIRQLDSTPEIEDIHAAVLSTLGDVGVRCKPGASVAVAVGSRGIADLVTVVAATVDFLKRRGFAPFVVPAMGSHGGATAEGQIDVLAHLGITEEAIGCPIEATMDVVTVGEALGKPVFLDRYAFEADGIVVINRVKPHTDFAGPLGSGVLKMMTIGLSNHAGAVQQHRLMVHHGYERTIRATASAMLDTGRILCGLAIVENKHDRPAVVRALSPETMIADEEALLTLARAWMPRLPVEKLDLLVVENMGKEISGAGMDSNVLGRHSTYFEPQFTTPRITFVAVLNLTDHSGGNAAGIGGADFATRAMIDKVDWNKTYTNSLTSGGAAGSRMPVVLDSDEDVVRIAVSCLGLDDPQQARIARIRNTLALHEIEVSTSVWNELDGKDDIVRISDPHPITFDENGQLV